MPLDTKEVMALGRIEGKLDMLVVGMQRQDEKLEAMDERLRHVETQSSKTAALSGAIAAIGTAIAVEIAKRAF